MGDEGRGVLSEGDGARGDPGEERRERVLMGYGGKGRS